MCQPHDRIDTCLEKLKKFEDKQARKVHKVKTLRGKGGLKPSKAMTDYLFSHPAQEKIDTYMCRENGPDSYLVCRRADFNDGNLANGHVVTLNRFQVCRQQECLCLCKKCGPASLCKVSYIEDY
jgi:hypothetical protein